MKDTLTAVKEVISDFNTNLKIKDKLMSSSDAVEIPLIKATNESLKGYGI